MTNKHIFIAHSSKDDDFVKELREKLEGFGLSVWVDSRNLRGGDKLSREVEDAIEQSRQFIAVISPNTINSPWVRKEIQKASEVERRRNDGEYRIVPLLLPGVEASALQLWFDDEPVGVSVEITPSGLDEILPDVLAALGESLPTDRQPIKNIESQPIEELILRLNDLKIETTDSKCCVIAIAQLFYKPANKSARAIESKRFTLTAPLGAVEAEELRWYLEEYFVWPFGVFRQRAERIEAQLPKWGQALFQSTFASQAGREALGAWQQAGLIGERRFSVFVDGELAEGASEERQAEAREAASQLLTLPWELLHDGRGFLFHGRHPVSVRRRLPNRYPQRIRATQLPIRILLVSPRPEDVSTSYIDHRISAKPLVEAIESLGELVKLSILTPPTFPALEEALRKAAEAGKPFDVVHFDGHGIYDHKVGLGGLCFEDPNDVQKLERRAMQLVHAEKLAEVLRDHRIPLVFLEACQSAKTEENPTASVAAKLLEEGCTSVVAMSHSVLVETAHRFVSAFYKELAQGKRVGAAMLAGQRDLHRDSYRGKMMGTGDLHLQDWFIPVLYQEEQDLQLVTKVPAQAVQQLQDKQRRLNLGSLPAAPAHKFQGRSRELLALERLLNTEPYAMIRGKGGAGKTTLAIEAARWLVQTGRFRRAAFVSLEQYTDVRAVLDSLGQQLLPEGDAWSVAKYPDLKQALQPLERALADHATIIVLDNLESILPVQVGQVPSSAEPIQELFDLCLNILEVSSTTRIIFTSREPFPAPFYSRRREIVLGPLSQEDAIKLVSEVMKQQSLAPKSDDAGNDPQEVIDLVEAADRHARALVLLAQEISHHGVRATTSNIHQLMADLHRKYPNDRERSMYASLELSLRRLPPEIRKQIRVLGVFHGGVSLFLLFHMLGVEREAVMRLANNLIKVGLAEYVGDTHLRLDPALPSYLLAEMDDEERSKAQAEWAKLMEEYAGFLYRQIFQNIDVSNRVTLLELPNLLALLDWTIENSTAEDVVHLASGLEQLIAPLGRRRVLAKLTEIRQQATQRLDTNSDAKYDAECRIIDRLLDCGELHAAYDAAKKLLERLLSVEEGAYQGLDYDLAIANLYLGRITRTIGNVDLAMNYLLEAQHRFQLLTNENNKNAEKMLDVVISEIGMCFADTGQSNKAIILFEDEIKKAARLGYKRDVAVLKNNLAYVYVDQGNYAKALELLFEGKQIFEELAIPRDIASAWHQIGLTYRRAGSFQQAERPYKEALAIEVREQDFTGEARTLDELGILYSQMGRFEESIAFSKQAVNLRHKLGDARTEGISRSNLAITLIKIQHYDEARQELQRAIECKLPYGHTAETWKTWHSLYRLEKAVGNLQAASQARQQAIESFLAYRRDGGQSTTHGAQLCAQTIQSIKQGTTVELEEHLVQILKANVPSSFKLLVSKLQSILRGDRNPSLAGDPNLDFSDAVELRLLLEVMGAT